MLSLSKKRGLFVSAPVGTLALAVMGGAWVADVFRTEPDPGFRELAGPFPTLEILVVGTLASFIWVKRRGDELHWVRCFSRGVLSAKRTFLIAKRDHYGRAPTVDLSLHTLSGNLLIEVLNDDGTAEAKIRKVVDTLGVRFRLPPVPEPAANRALEASNESSR